MASSRTPRTTPTPDGALRLPPLPSSRKERLQITVELKSINPKASKWDNVAEPVKDSVTKWQTAFKDIENWCNDERKFMTHLEHNHAEVAKRVEVAEKSLDEKEVRLNGLLERIEAAAKDQRQKSEILAACLGSQLRASSTLFRHFGVTWGMSVSDGDSCEPPAAPASPDSLADLLQADSLAKLMSGSGGLEDQASGPMAKIFEKWGAWREKEADKGQGQMGLIEDLKAHIKASQDRMLAWRDQLKETSHVVDSVVASLAETQASVKELQVTQVLKEDVGEAVARSARQLEELQAKAERRVDEVFGQVEAHFGEVEAHVRRSRGEVEERIDEQGRAVQHMVERNINAITPYLNTMHVKADAQRQELDDLSTRVPPLKKAIDEVITDLQQRDDAGQKRHEALEGILKRLTVEVIELSNRGQGHHEVQTSSMQELSESLRRQLEGVREVQKTTILQVDELRSTSIPSVARDLIVLEQKVAKWVHAQPLPAKVSEARLFSLEARLAEETDARLQMEQLLRFGRPTDKAGRSLSQLTPRSGGGGELPQLAPSAPAPRELADGSYPRRGVEAGAGRRPPIAFDGLRPQAAPAAGS